MARWQGCWLVGLWLLFPGFLRADEPLLVPRATEASDITQANEPLRLARPANGAARSSNSPNSSRSTSTSWTTTTASLLFVLTLIVGGGYFLSRQGRRFAGILPDEVVQVLGRRALDQRSSLHFVRCGSKILVLANSAQQGLRTLSEITDPREVEWITGQCLPQAANATTGSSAPIPTPHLGSSPRSPNGTTAAGGNRG